MDARLQKLISDYLHAVADAILLLEDAGLKRPRTSTEWVGLDVPYSGSLSGGHVYYKHGFGCSVQGPLICVDFDFGSDGEINGFSMERLLKFAHRLERDYGFRGDDDFACAFERAVRDGDIVFSGYINYYSKAVLQ